MSLPWIHSVHERWRTVRTHGSMRRSMGWTMRTHRTVRRHGRMHAGWRTVGSKVRRTRWPHELMMWRWTSGWHRSTHVRRWRPWTHHAWRWRPILWSEGERWAGRHVGWARRARTTRRLTPDGGSRGSNIWGRVWHTGTAKSIKLADWRRLKVVGWWRSWTHHAWRWSIRGHRSTIWHRGSTHGWGSGWPHASGWHGNGGKSGHTWGWKWRSTGSRSRSGWTRVAGWTADISGPRWTRGWPTRYELRWATTGRMRWTWRGSMKGTGKTRCARAWHSRSRGRRGSGRRTKSWRVVYRWPTRAGPRARSEVSLPARDGLF